MDTSDEPGGYNLEIDLGEEVARERSRKVERWVRELAGEDGVHEAIREDREIILVRGPIMERGRSRGLGRAAHLAGPPPRYMPSSPLPVPVLW